MNTTIAGADDYNRAAVCDSWPSICDATNSYIHPDLTRMLELWQSIAADDIPLRRVLSLRLLKRHMRDAAFFERISPESGERRYRVRYTGSAFGQILGDFTGMFIDDAIAPHFAERWEASLDATLGAGAPLRFLARADTSNMGFLTGEFFSAPLRDDTGQANLVISAARFSSRLPWAKVEAQARADLGML